MSVTAMSWAWKQPLDPTAKFVLLALADHANDVDFTCWPSLNSLQTKTGFSRPTIWKAIDRLVELKVMKRVGLHANGSTLYEVQIGNDVTLGNELTQVTTLPLVGNDVAKVGNVGNKVGNDVTPNHNNHHESSMNHHAMKFSDDDFKTAKRMYEDILKINAGHKTPNLEKWANTIRLLRQIDGRAIFDIVDLWSWANNDPFWQSNILSPDKLRKKWDQLMLKKNIKPGGKKKTYEDYQNALKPKEEVRNVNNTFGAMD